MEKGQITVFCGEGKGKTSAAVGQAVLAASQGRSTIIIQFLKGKAGEQIGFIKRLEPEIKVFSFEKLDINYQALSQEEQQEEAMNIRNGINFARKVLSTEGCDLLVLDEVLGLVDQKIVSEEEMIALIEAKEEGTELILTGIQMCDALYAYVDEVFRIDALK